MNIFVMGMQDAPLNQEALQTSSAFQTGKRKMKKEYSAGFDIGGTKCAVILGKHRNGSIDILGKRKFATADFRRPQNCLAELCRLLAELETACGVAPESIQGIGISCGGPLDSERGIVQSPPNLPGWDNIPAAEFVRKMTEIPARLENDANACALAEWKYGAGRGTQNMIFLTFGTGLGGGIIMNGRLCSGACGMAGECGHIRLAQEGPLGYGKHGSFEGFCSGGGLAQLGRIAAAKALDSGRVLSWCRDRSGLEKITAKTLAEAAENGDPDALAVYSECGRRLGEGLSVLIDLLNPERIVIGSIFARAERLLRPEMERAIAREALSVSAKACRIVPAGLGESIGDFASLSIWDRA